MQVLHNEERIGLLQKLLLKQLLPPGVTRRVRQVFLLHLLKGAQASRTAWPLL